MLQRSRLVACSFSPSLLQHTHHSQSPHSHRRPRQPPNLGATRRGPLNDKAIFPVISILDNDPIWSLSYHPRLSGPPRTSGASYPCFALAVSPVSPPFSSSSTSKALLNDSKILSDQHSQLSIYKRGTIGRVRRNANRPGGRTSKRH